VNITFRFRANNVQSGAILAAALQDEDLASSDDGAPANRGSADEDDESVDEDFQADSESEVGEEFDSDHQSSGSDSDAEMGEGDADADSDAAPEATEAAVPERPKKKQKTSL
jgi:structure-specific recognition protein 1